MFEIKLTIFSQACNILLNVHVIGSEYTIRMPKNNRLANKRKYFNKI